VNPHDLQNDPTTETKDSEDIERLDISSLGSMMSARRGNLSLRKAAAAAGLSVSTFSRVESGHHPDLTSFLLLCQWLGVPPSQFFTPVTSRDVTPLDEAIAHLRADPRLEPDAAKKIADMLRTMYSALAKAETPQPVIACHLRAASVLRPGVPERLNALLNKMHEQLAERIAAGEL
jgi:transcriptional regulator with XRE-family HTH domain